jgi:hypothetical protein
MTVIFIFHESTSGSALFVAALGEDTSAQTPNLQP